jgi:hypothetical protein
MKAFLSAALAIVGYAVACFVLMFFVGSEALAVSFGVAIALLPVVLFLGVIAGRVLSNSKTTTVGLVGCSIGFLLPCFVVYLWSASDDLGRASSNAAHLRESRKAFDEAKTEGFPFPPDAESRTRGEVSTSLSTKEAIAFYDVSTLGTWTSHKYGNSAWYVRRSSGGMTDRITIGLEFQKTRIHYGKLSETELRIAVANSFSGACTFSQWATAKDWCSPRLQARLATGGLQGKLGSVRPSSRAFSRSNGKYEIAVDAKRDLGGNRFQSCEIGFKFTNDPIPLIDEIEL